MSPVHYDHNVRRWKSDFDHHKRKPLPRDDLRRHFPASGCINRVMGTEPARPRLFVIPDCDAQLNSLPDGLQLGRINTIASDFEGCNIDPKELVRIQRMQIDYPFQWRQMLDREPDFPCNHRALFDDPYFAGREVLPKARVLTVGNCEGLSGIVDLWRTPCITKKLYDYVNELKNDQHCLIWDLKSELGWWDRSRMFETKKWKAPAAWCDIQHTLHELRISTTKLKPNLVQYTGVDLARQCNRPEWFSFSDKQFQYIENMNDPLDYLYYCALDVALPQLQLCREYSYRQRYSCDKIDPYDASQVWGLLSSERWGTINPEWIREDQFVTMREAEVKWLKHWLSLSEAESASHPYPKSFGNQNSRRQPLANAYLMDPFQQCVHPIPDIDLEATNALWPQMRFYSNSDWEQRHDTYQDLFGHMTAEHLDLDVHLTIPPDMWCPLQHKAATPSHTMVGTTVQASNNPSAKYCAYFATDSFLQIHNLAGIKNNKGPDCSANAQKYFRVADKFPMVLPVVFTQNDGDILSDDFNTRFNCLRRIENHRQFSRNLMVKEEKQCSDAQLSERVSRKLQPYLKDRHATYREPGCPPEYGPRCALPQQTKPPSYATYQQHLDAERQAFQAKQDDRFQRRGPRAKSVLSNNRPSFNVRQRKIKIKQPRIPEDYYGEPGSHGWDGSTPAPRPDEQHGGRSQSPMEGVSTFVQRWVDRSRSPSPSPSSRAPRTRSVHHSRLVPYNYDNVSTDDTLANYVVDHNALRSPAESHQSALATDDSDCQIITDEAGPSHNVTHDSHPHTQPVVDISNPTKQRLLPVDEQQPEPESTPSATKSARLALPPPAAPQGRGRGRGRGRGAKPPDDNAPHPNPGNMVAVSLPPIYAASVSRTIENTGRLNNHDDELQQSRQRLAAVEHQLMLLTRSHTLLLTQAQRCQHHQPALAASASMQQQPPYDQQQQYHQQQYDQQQYQQQQYYQQQSQQQLSIQQPQPTWGTAPPPLAIACASSTPPADSFSLFPDAPHPMQVDNQLQQSTAKRQSSVSFQENEPASTSAVPPAQGAIPRGWRPTLRTQPSTRSDAAQMPASSSSITITEVSSTPYVAPPSTEASTSQQQSAPPSTEASTSQQQPGPAPPVDQYHLAPMPAPLPAAPAAPVSMQDEEVQADEAEYLQPSWYDIGLHWADGPPPHDEALYDLHRELIEDESYNQGLNNDTPVVALIRFFVYIGPSPPGDSTLHTPAYMDKIAAVFMKQLRDLARVRFPGGVMIQVSEVFNLLINANIAFMRRFHAHCQLGYPNDIHFAACLQAYRIKVAVARAVSSSQSNVNVWRTLPACIFAYLPVHEIYQGFAPILYTTAPALGRIRTDNYWALREADLLGDHIACKALTEYYLILQRNRGVLGGFTATERVNFDRRRGTAQAYLRFISRLLAPSYLEVHEYYYDNNLHNAQEDPFGYEQVRYPEPPAPNNNQQQHGPQPPAPY